MQMIDALEYYIEDIEFHDPELMTNLQYLGKLPEVMSSEQLLSLEFETIGLQGRWKELIGDPSVGFSMMVLWAAKEWEIYTHAGVCSALGRKPRQDPVCGH